MEMGWDSGSFFPGTDTQYDLGISDPSSYGSPDPSAYYGGDPGTGVSGVQADAPYSPASGATVGSELPGPITGNQGAGIPQPPLAMNIGAPGAQGLFPGAGSLGGLNSVPGILGLGGGLAGLIGTLASGGVTGTSMPRMGTAATAQMNQANQALQPFALGQTPLQMQQASMLDALSRGQIPAGFAQLVARAYDPAYQNAAQRSIEAARQSGFYDNPLSSPVGGAIMGPAAAQLQGQQADSLLGLLQSLPALYNQPISNQIGAAQSQSGNLLGAARLGTGQIDSQPLGAQIGQGFGNALTGIAQGIQQNQNATNQQAFQQQLLNNQQQQNAQWQQLMGRLAMGQGGGGTQAPQQPGGFDFSNTYVNTDLNTRPNLGYTPDITLSGQQSY